MESRLVELVNRAIKKYGSILEAPENCEEFIEIRRISPECDKPGSIEYEERKKARKLKQAERDRKILDLLDEGYPADMVADKLHLSSSTVRAEAKRYGIVNFSSYFIWHAERNGIQYYSTMRKGLEERGFKKKDIQRVKLLKPEIPNRAHYFEFGNWHIKREKEQAHETINAEDI